MPAQPDEMNAKVAVEMAGDEVGDRDLVVDVAGGFGAEANRRRTMGPFP